jgi:LDH2 family malate/lactate/ureidoglycolate dehydrogenase
MHHDGRAGRYGGVDFAAAVKRSMLKRETMVSVAELKAVCVAALERIGAPSDIATRVVESLIANELSGYGSHGIIRVIEYVDAVKEGDVTADARPTVELLSGHVGIVNGNRGFGTLAGDCVAATLVKQLDSVPLCAVGLVNSGHIGRLADIGRTVGAKGYGVLGFVTFVGGRTPVAPWGGREGRLGTNPLLVAMPGSDSTFLLDMSTSAVSEGRIRERWLARQRIPPGWLVDRRGRGVSRADRLYSSPPSALIPPLGGSLGYKGFGLGVAVELLGGTLVMDALASPRQASGNRGLFVGLRPTMFGISMSVFQGRVDEVRGRVLDPLAPARWPGDAGPLMQERPNVVGLEKNVWKSLCVLAKA